MMAKPTLEVVFVEDDEALGQATAQALELGGARVKLFRDAKAALRDLSPDFGGLVVSDVRLPGMDGLAFFERLRAIDADIPVIFTTGHGDVPMAVEALKNGAADFFTKPYSSGSLLRSVELAFQKRTLVLENRRLREALSERTQEQIIGSSAAAEQLRNVVAAVAKTEIDVVIEGALGAGKNYVARLLHKQSARANRPFVTIDAGVLAHEDAELLLFGRDPSAGLSRTGMIERANGGTLFLDEVETANNVLLTRLVSTLKSHSILPAGADRPRKLDIRIIAATLAGENMGSVTHSLNAIAHRIGAVRIVLPPLASRREDLADFFRHFVVRHERDLQLESRPISDREWRWVQTHDWPGNLRELSNFARAFVLGLENVEASVPTSRSLQDMVGEFEKAVLEDALREAGGNVAKVQASLNTPRKTIYDKLARYKLKPTNFR